MFKSILIFSVLALGAGFASHPGTAETAIGPFFGDAMSGIYQPAKFNSPAIKQTSAAPQDCTDFDCPQAKRPPLSHHADKLLP